MNSVVPIWGKASLRLTEAARSELLALMKQVDQFRPIACVSWVFDVMEAEGDEIKHRGPHWGIGFYSPEQVPAESIVDISGVPFVFVAGDAARLNGTTLDLVKGEFVVDEGAT